MPEVPTLQFALPIARVRVLGVTGVPRDDPRGESTDEDRATTERLDGIIQAERARMADELKRQKGQFAQQCEMAGNIVKNLDRLYQDTVANNRAEIARLAVEIARKILMQRVAQGDYDIQAIVEEALKRAPAHEGIVVRLNPEDLPPCQQHQQENPDSPFAELEFAADWSVGRGECLVETPKGIVKSFIEEHLERLAEALQKVE